VSLLITAIILGAALFTSFVSSIFGMLGGLLLMAVLITIMSTGPAMVLHGLIQFVSNSYRAFLNRKDIQWRIISVFLVGAVAALWGLTFFAFVPNEAAVLIALGLLPFIAAGLPNTLTLDISRPYMPVLVGLIVVPVNVLTGVGGPILDIFFQRVSLTRHQVVATKAVIQALAHTTKIIYFGVLVGSTQNWPNALLLHVLDNLNDKAFFAWTSGIVMATGGLILVRGLSLVNY
jgi:uncharacterized membrane protein YfcA